MVKFGRHLEAFLEENQGSNLFVVPYSKIRDDFVECSTTQVDEQQFRQEWQHCLLQARNDFDEAMSKLWERLFQEGTNADLSSRGATPDQAFRTFLTSSTIESSQEVFARINVIYETVLANGEALRKLVKKFDKQHKAHLSPTLLPKLYASNFIVGQPTLEDGISMLRQVLQVDEDDVEESGNSRSSLKRVGREQQQDNLTVERRREELVWLKQLVASIAPSELQHIVAHRGFHNPNDRSDRRPLENSLQAYEAAWTNGIHLCECDITLTKDEKLVLAHDEDFTRLALDKDLANRKVRDLTFRELISLPLKSGIRPPLLIDVLRSARAIGGKSQLIIEIKPGNNDAAKALARMFIRHPDLMEQCAVVMSFDLFTMHSLRLDLATVLGPNNGNGPVRESHRSTMSLGNFGGIPMDASTADFSSVTRRDSFHEHVLAGGFVPLGPRRDSFDHFGVGLSLSTRSETHQSFRVGDGASPIFRSKAMPPLSGSLLNLTLDENPRKLPKLILLTVAHSPKIPCELQVGVNDLHEVKKWLHRGDGSLDGVYLQFQQEMMHPEGTENLRKCASECSVGVWNRAHHDPDDYETFHHLVRNCNVSFVNSDLPKGFNKKAAAMDKRGVSYGA